MRWGILFRREINLTYARIQDIHLRSNLIERWLGLARIEVQTASGSAGAEMILEGLLEYEAIRDYLYSHMRGGDDRKPARGGRSSRSAPVPNSPVDGQFVETLNAVTAEVRALREAMENAAGRRHE
jgi:putative membrane protein